MKPSVCGQHNHSKCWYVLSQCCSVTSQKNGSTQQHPFIFVWAYLFMQGLHPGSSAAVSSTGSETEQVHVLRHCTCMNQSGVTVHFVPQLQFTLVFIHSAQVLIFDCGYPKLVAGMLVIHSVIFFVLFFDFYQRTYIRDHRAQKKLQ
jgi:hypothetical protein